MGGGVILFKRQGIIFLRAKQMDHQVCHTVGYHYKAVQYIMIQSSAAITRSNLWRFYTQHCYDSSRTWIRLEAHNRALAGELWGLLRKLEKTACVITTPHCITCKTAITAAEHKSWFDLTKHTPISPSSASYVMMTSLNGNIFRVTGPLCGEFTGHRWIPRTKASDAELWCFLWFAPE